MPVRQCCQVDNLHWQTRVLHGISPLLYSTPPSSIRFHIHGALCAHLQVNEITFGHPRLWRVPGI